MDEDFKQLLRSIGIKTTWFGLFYKSTYRVLKEISRKWDNLDNDTQDKISLGVLGLKK